MKILQNHFAERVSTNFEKGAQIKKFHAQLGETDVSVEIKYHDGTSIEMIGTRAEVAERLSEIIYPNNVLDAQFLEERRNWILNHAPLEQSPSQEYAEPAAPAVAMG